MKIIDDIRKLVSIESVRDIASKRDGAPFGKGIDEAFQAFLEIAERMGFRTVNMDGYVCYAEIGPKSDDYVGVLGHLDVVEAGGNWDTPPFELTIKDNIMFGRGVNDDKGPLVGALYAAKRVYDSKVAMKYPIRVIAGGAEETTWECMEHYFKTEAQPKYAFSPDSNFPIVNEEKGILQLNLTFSNFEQYEFISEVQRMYNCSNLVVNGTTYESNQTLSRNPHRSDHAYQKWLKTVKADTPLIQFLRSLDPSKNDDISYCVMSINTEGDKHIVGLDVRYRKAAMLQVVLKDLSVYQYEITRHLKPLYVHEDSKLIQSLKSAYETVMKESAAVLTKGGASYARVLTNGVAFGATFEGENPRPHMPNENMSIGSLLKAIDIYEEALKRLVQDV